MKLRWSQRARGDLIEIAAFIARDNAPAARAWIKRLRARARLAAANPFAGRVVPEREEDLIREVLVRSYRIIYRIRSKEIVVLTVLEGHRQLRQNVLDQGS